MQNLPKIVIARLQSGSDVKADAHPDTDLLTAFSEQSLADNERELVTQHLARCGDCREVIALALPASDGAEVVARVESVRQGNWLGWRVLSWGALTASVLAVTSVGVFQLRQRHEEKAPAVLMARNGLEQRSAEPLKRDAKIEVSNLRPPVPQSPSNSEKAAHSVSAMFAPTTRPRSPISKKQTVSSAVSTPSGDSPTSGSPTSDSGSTADSAIAGDSSDETRVGKAKALPQPSAAMAPAPALHADPGLMKGVLPRWTISSDGILQRSLDSGKSWTNVDLVANNSASTNPSRDLAEAKITAAFHALSVSSNGSEVWVGGSSGALYHTFDAGDFWSHVTPAAGVTFSGDVINIQFPDSRHGTISTSSGEVWTTNDDGQTWSKQQ